MNEIEYTKVPYLPPLVEVSAVTLEKGFAYSLRGDSDGLGLQPAPAPPANPFGQYQDGDNWTESGWTAN